MHNTSVDLYLRLKQHLIDKTPYFTRDIVPLGLIGIVCIEESLSWDIKLRGESTLSY